VDDAGEPTMTPCTHRGEVFREVRNTFCGFKQNFEKIFRCRLYVLCCERKYQYGQAERCCLTCDDYEGVKNEENGTQPVDGCGG
jgi:hypothetical protein